MRSSSAILEDLALYDTARKKILAGSAKKARKGVNPFTGEEMMFKAKPASKAVKALALKGLKDMV